MNKEELKSQLKELVSIYSLDNTLCVLGFDSKDEYVVYPLMQHNSLYKSYFKVKNEDIKCRSSILI